MNYYNKYEKYKYKYIFLKGGSTPIKVKLFTDDELNNTNFNIDTIKTKFNEIKNNNFIFYNKNVELGQFLGLGSGIDTNDHDEDHPEVVLRFKNNENNIFFYKGETPEQLKETVKHIYYVQI
jgi:hypothetical protein